MTYDYILTISKSKISQDAVKHAVEAKQQLINEGKFAGMIIREDEDLDMDISKISHMIAHMEYKNGMVRVVIKTLNTERGRIVEELVGHEMLFPVIVGRGKINPLSQQIDDWEIKSVGFLDKPIFPVERYTEARWQGDHFDEDLFTV